MNNFKDITLRQFEELEKLFNTYCSKLGIQPYDSGIITRDETFFITRYDKTNSFKELKSKVESLERDLERVGLVLKDVQLESSNIYRFKASGSIDSIIDKLHREIDGRKLMQNE